MMMGNRCAGNGRVPVKICVVWFSDEGRIEKTATALVIKSEAELFGIEPV